MKRKVRNLIVYVLVGALAAGSVCTFPVHAADTEVAGDVNRDGTVDVRDLVRLKKYCADENVSIDKKQADWDGNGTINLDDVARLRRWLVNNTAENAPVGLETNIFSAENGTLNVVDTETFPQVTFSNSSNKQTTDIIIDDSKFFDEVTMYDAISFKLRYAPEDGTLRPGAKGLAVSVVLGETVLKAASAMTENSWAYITLSQDEMDSYREKRTADTQLCIRLTATQGSGLLGTYKYQLELKDFCVADELHRFNCDNTVGGQYGTMSDAAEVPVKSYPFAASCYTNGRYDKWSFISIEDSDYRSNITQYDSIEFDAMIPTPEVGEFDSVQLDMILGEAGDEIPLDEPYILEYNEWLHISLSPNSIYQYRDRMDVTSLKLRLTVVGENKEADNTIYELYIRNFRVVKDGNKESFKNAESMFAHWYQEEQTQPYFSSKSGSLARIQETVGDRTGEFTKYQNVSTSVRSFITIHDELFKQDFTAEDSIRFYAYAEKNEDFDKESVSLALVDNSTSEQAIKGDMTLPFGEWTLVTMNGEEVQKYLDANNGLRIRMTTRPNTASEHLGYVLYLTDIEVLKLANADLTADMLTIRNDGGCCSLTAADKTHGVYSGTHVTLVNTWAWYPRVQIDDSKIKQVIEAGDSLELWVYMEHNNGGADGQASFWLSTCDDDTPIGGQANLVQNGQVWTQIVLDAEDVKKYLKADAGLQICIELEADYPQYKLTIGELAVVKDSTPRKYASTDGSIVKVGGPVHEKEEDIFTKYVNNASARKSFITINELAWPAKITKKDSIRFYVYAEKNSGFDADTVSLALVDNDGHSIVIKEDMTISFGEWIMVTLNGEEVQKYLDANKGLCIQLNAKPDEKGSDFGYTMYLTDVEVLKLANADITADMLTISNDGGNCSLTAADKTHGVYSGTHMTLVNTWAWYPRVQIDDSEIKQVIETGDSLELWVYMEHNNGGADGQASFWLSTCDDKTPIGGQANLVQNGQVWTRIVLDAEGVQKYLEADAGLQICIDLEADYPQYKLTIGELAVVKSKSGKLQTVTNTYEEQLTAAPNMVHGAYESVAAKYTNEDWNMWSYISVDDSGFKKNISKYDAIEFWVYASGVRANVETLSLAIVSENKELTIKEKVILTEDAWTQVKLTPEEVAAYIQYADGMKFLLSAEGETVWDEGGTDYTLYIDEFQVITDGYYDEVTALEKYQCTNDTSAGTFVVDYDMIRGTDNRCSAAFTNHKNSRRTYITIDDTAFCNKATKDTVIKLWAYLKPSENAGCDYSSITLSVGTSTEASSILEGQELTFNEWNEICLSGEAMERYLAKQAGLRLCVTVVGGSDMSYVLCLEDLQVMRTSDTTSGNLSVVDVYVADSSDKVLQDEDCSYLGSDFALTAYRNEYESGQLILTSAKDVSGFTVSATDFVCGDATLKADLFEIYTEYYHEVDLIYDTESKQSVGMYPDALIPMETAAKFGLNRIVAEKNQGIWIAVKIPETQQAGTYTGKLRLTLGEQVKEVSAKVTVVDYTLPNTVSLQNCIPVSSYYIGKGELDYSDAIYTEYIDILNKFRLAGQYVCKASTDPDGYQRGLEEARATLEYAQKESCSAYAIRVVETEDDTYTWVLNQGLLEKYLRAYIDVSIEEQVDLFEKAYIYMGQIIDEPVINGWEARAQYVSMQINDAVKNALTYLDNKSCDADFHARLKQSLSELQHVVTADKIEELSAVNTYCPMIDVFDSSLDTEKRKGAGNYWWYTCTLPKIPYPTYHIDDEAASARIMGWLARENGVKGYLTWEVIYPYDAEGNTLHGVDWYDNVHRWYDAYGDGFLVYPGRIFELDTPIQSLRLYAMCDGMEDYEALADLENRYQELAEQYQVSISADGILDYIYDLLADNTRCYGEGADIVKAREILTQLLILAQEGTAISDFYIEDGKAHYKVVKATGITEETYTFESAVTYAFAGSDFTKTDNVTVATEGNTIAATVEGMTEYSVVCNVSKAGLTKTTDRMYLTMYNDSSEEISVKVYSNQTEYLDTFLLKPGKNILPFAQMQQLKWFPRKGMTSIEFKITTPDTTGVKMRFGKITKWD